jgi:hypothetical protein
MLAVLAIMAGCAVYLFLKSTFIKAFATAIAAACAGALALGLFGILAKTLTSLSGNMDLLVQWGEPLCFALLFIVAFAILQTIVSLLTRKPIDLGLWPERIGRALIGLLLGFILSRVLCSILIMTFLPSLQTDALGKYISYKGINPPKKIEQKKTAIPAAPRKTEQTKEPKKGKLSNTSKSVLGPGFDE